MSNLTDTFTNIADAIRTKKGTTDTIPAQNFATEILKLSSKNYKIVSGTQQKTSSTTAPSFTLTFDTKIIAIIFTFGSWINGTSADATYKPSNFCVNPNASFFTDFDISFDVNGLVSAPTNYPYYNKYGSYATFTDEYNVTLKSTTGTASYWIMNYIAILEP